MTGVAVPDRLRATLLGLDLRLRRCVETFRDDLLIRATDPLRGLVITDAETAAVGKPKEM